MLSLRSFRELEVAHVENPTATIFGWRREDHVVSICTFGNGDEVVRSEIV